MKRLLLIIALATMCSQIKAQIVAVNTDLLMDLAQTPSLGAELVVGERSTVGLNALFNRNPWGRRCTYWEYNPNIAIISPAGPCTASLSVSADWPPHTT